MLGEVVARRHIPLLLRGVPRNRRLVQEAVDLDEITAAEITGADEIANRQINAADFLAVVFDDFLVAELAVLAVDSVGAAGLLVDELAVRRLGPRVELGE